MSDKYHNVKAYYDLISKLFDDDTLYTFLINGRKVSKKEFYKFLEKIFDERVVYCKDCKYLVFSDCYGECSKAFKGIVRPNDYCGYGIRR